MLGSHAARAAPASAGGDPQNFERLAGAFDDHTDTAPAELFQEEPAEAIDFRLAGVGLNEPGRALLDCWPLVLHPLCSSLFALGIHGDGVNGRGAFDALHVADVIFRPGGRFDFSSEVGTARGSVAGVIIPLRDECGDLADLAAWNPDDGALALWRGVASMLGEDQLNAPRIESETLAVFADCASWLRAGRRGVVVIDADRARWRLTGETLVVDDPAFGRRLRDSLVLPEPKIFVASNRVSPTSPTRLDFCDFRRGFGG
jgi:hypothetical protein